MSATTTPIPVIGKAAKVVCAVDLTAFSFDAVPPVGTPGAKNLSLTYEVLCDGGAVLLATVRVPSLQKLSAAAAASEHGGFVVFQGKLAPDNRTLLEAGVVFQPKAAPAPVPATPVEATA